MPPIPWPPIPWPNPWPQEELFPEAKDDAAYDQTGVQKRGQQPFHQKSSHRQREMKAASGRCNGLALIPELPAPWVLDAWYSTD